MISFMSEIIDLLESKLPVGNKLIFRYAKLVGSGQEFSLIVVPLLPPDVTKRDAWEWKINLTENEKINISRWLKHACQIGMHI